MAAVAQAEVQRLEGELQQCVAALQFEAAATLRDRLKALKARLAAEAEAQRLEAQLQRHVAALEFEAAAQLRDRIRALRNPPTGQRAAERLSAGDQQDHDASQAKRTVFLTPLPLNTDKTQLRRHFSAARHVRIHKHKTGTHKHAWVVFNNAQEAEAVAAPGKMNFDGRPIFVRIDGDQEALKKNLMEVNYRTVSFGRLPLTIQHAEVVEIFPHAEIIRIARSEYYTTAFVSFTTLEEARDVASQSRVRLAGHGCYATMADDKAAIKHNMAEMDRRTVFLSGLPPAVSEVQLKERFPTADCVRLCSKESRPPFAFITLSTAAEADSLAQEQTIAVAGQVANIRLMKDNNADEEEQAADRTVFLSDLVSGTSKQDVGQRFPTAVRVKVHEKRSHAFAFVTFATAEEAIAFAQQAEVEVAGKAATVQMADGKDRESRKRSSDEHPTQPKRHKP
eukprot:EG_transcript_9362